MIGRVHYALSTCQRTFDYHTTFDKQPVITRLDITKCLLCDSDKEIREQNEEDHFLYSVDHESAGALHIQGGDLQAIKPMAPPSTFQICLERGLANHDWESPLCSVSVGVSSL